MGPQMLYTVYLYIYTRRARGYCTCTSTVTVQVQVHVCTVQVPEVEIFRSFWSFNINKTLQSYIIPSSYRKNLIFILSAPLSCVCTLYLLLLLHTSWFSCSSLFQISTSPQHSCLLLFPPPIFLQLHNFPKTNPPLFGCLVQTVWIENPATKLLIWNCRPFF